MANYNRDTGEALEKAGDAAKIGIGGLVFGILAGVVAQTGKNAKMQEYQNQIEECDRKIAALRSQFLGGFLNSEEIEALEKKRAELISKRDNL